MRDQRRLGMFIALGAAVGVAIGAGTHRIASGLALGTAFGVRSAHSWIANEIEIPGRHRDT